MFASAERRRASRGPRRKAPPPRPRRLRDVTAGLDAGGPGRRGCATGRGSARSRYPAGCGAPRADRQVIVGVVAAVAVRSLAALQVAPWQLTQWVSGSVYPSRWPTPPNSRRVSAGAIRTAGGEQGRHHQQAGQNELPHDMIHGAFLPRLTSAHYAPSRLPSEAGTPQVRAHARIWAPPLRTEPDQCIAPRRWENDGNDRDDRRPGGARPSPRQTPARRRPGGRPAGALGGFDLALRVRAGSGAHPRLREAALT